MSKLWNSSALTSTPDSWSQKLTEAKKSWLNGIGVEYVDSTTFNDLNTSWGSSSEYIYVAPQVTAYDDDPPPFDYDAARKLYEDDPVVLAIIDRMATME